MLIVKVIKRKYNIAGNHLYLDRAAAICKSLKTSPALGTLSWTLDLKPKIKPIPWTHGNDERLNQM